MGMSVDFIRKEYQRKRSPRSIIQTNKNEIVGGKALMRKLVV